MNGYLSYEYEIKIRENSVLGFFVYFCHLYMIQYMNIS